MSPTVPVVPSAHLNVVWPVITEPSASSIWVASAVRSISVMPSSARVFDVVEPSAFVTRSLNFWKSASSALRTPSPFESNTDASASRSLVAVGSHSVKTN
ncbi:hypothetical protein LP7551_04489 [Roseibium album]|nr:hypothetical protein LP7551_04489 [Roseibium album]